MSGYVATFERIGRNHNVPPLTISGTPDEMAGRVYRYSLGFLGSRDVMVSVDLEEMKGSINGGRFGSFTLIPIEATS